MTTYPRPLPKVKSFARQRKTRTHLIAATFISSTPLLRAKSRYHRLSQGQAARESLLSVILFPLLLPVLLGGIKLFAQAFAGQEPETAWLGILGAFDALFAGAGLILFPFVYTGEE